MSDDFRAPAGWYPDPLGLPQLRWWNNQGWTEQVSAPPEPLRVQEQPRYAWKEEEPPVIPVQERTTFRAPAPPQQPVATSLNALEAPRAQNKVEQPTSYADWQSSQATNDAAEQFAARQASAERAAAEHAAAAYAAQQAAAAQAAAQAFSAPAPAAPAHRETFALPAAAAQPVAPAQPAAPVQPAATTPAPPAFWDDDIDSRPEPSVRPEDLKFWPGTSPAELRRAAREQAARDAQN